MKTFSDLKSAVDNSNTPEAAAGTFVDGLVTLFEVNRSDPNQLNSIINGIRGDRHELVKALTNGGKGSSSR